MEVLWQLCQEIAGLHPSRLATVSRGDVTVDLSSNAPKVKLIVELFKRVTLEGVERIPAGDVGRVVERVRAVRQLFEGIQDMRYTGPRRVGVLLDRAYSDIYESLAPNALGEVGRHQGHTHDVLTSMSQMRDALAEVQRMENEVRSLVRSTRKLATNVAAGEYAEIFLKTAQGYRREKARWLRALAVLVPAALIGVTWWFGTAWVAPPEASVGATVQMVAVRLFVFGVLSYAIVWVGRCYRAAAHNEVVTQHRHDALASVQVVVKAAPDVEAQNAVLTQAATSIFFHRPSGFAHKEDG